MNLCFEDRVGTFGFRPVFEIRDDVKIKDDVGDGRSPETAYEFYIK